MTNKDLVRKLRKGPDLDKYLEGRKKRYTTYGLGAILYSLGIHAFMDLAKEAKAIYRIRRIVLVNTAKLDDYIEMMYGDPESN